MKKLAVGLCLCLSAACASTLKPKEVDPEDTEQEPGFVKDGKFKSRMDDSGVTETIADAFSETEWPRFDLDSAAPDDDDGKWDLEFNRYFVRMNGGVSGSAGVEAAALMGEAFESVSAAPSDGFSSDREDSAEDSNSSADNVFNSPQESWFDYDLNSHQLSPHDVTYVVRSSEARFFKLRFEQYYDKNGTPAQMRFRWAEIDPPPGA